MATSTHAITPSLGINFTERTTSATHALGATVVGDQNELWIYVQANGAVATGTCTVNDTTFELTDAAGNFTTDVAFADNEYGWVYQTAKRAT